MQLLSGYNLHFLAVQQFKSILTAIVTLRCSYGACWSRGHDGDDIPCPSGMIAIPCHLSDLSVTTFVYVASRSYGMSSSELVPHMQHIHILGLYRLTD
jgi:hypothetical protein